MDALVLNYLNSRGFNEAAQVLQTEMNSKPANIQETVDRMGVVDPNDECAEDEERQRAKDESRQIIQKNVIASLCAQNQLCSEDLVMFSFLGNEAGNLQWYSESYDMYRSWALGSLDQVKTGLLSLCFPLFVTSYLSLVRRGALDVARLFWDRWHGDFLDLYAPELQMLSIITSPVQLDETAQGDFGKQPIFIKACVKNKFKCVITSLAFGLLTAFLAQQELLLPASIINDHVMFVRVETAPLLTDAGSGLLLELVGYTQVGVYTQKALQDRAPLVLGVPGNGLRAGKVSMPNFLQDEVYKNWIKNIVLRNLFVKAAKYEQNGLGRASDTSTGTSTGTSSSTNSSSSVSSSRSFWKPSSERGPVGDALEPSVLFATLTNAHEGLVCMEINRAAEQAVGGFHDHSVRVWSLTGKPFKGMGASRVSGNTAFETLQARSSRTVSTSSSVASGAAVSAAGGGERPSGIPCLTLRGHTAPVYSVSQEQAHSGGRLILSGSSDHTVRLWDTHVQQTVGKYHCAAAVWGVAFCPLGYYFATASADRCVSVYSTDRMTPVRFMGGQPAAGHFADVTCVAWHPSSTLLLSGSEDKTVMLWDVRSGACRRVLRGSPSPITCVCISPQGDRVAAGTDTGSVHVWDLASGSQLGLLQGHRGAVHSVAFSEAGEALSSGGADYTVRTWDMEALLPPQIGLHDLPPLHATVPIHKPAQCFHTKFTPAFCTTYTTSNLLLAGGPYSVSGAGLGRGTWMHDQKSEEEIIAALGLSSAQKN
jgi:transcription initiation factor TFIID subunit 5